MSPNPALDSSTVRLALAEHAYRTGTVRLVERDLRGCSHVVASRQGLFAVAEHGFRMVAHGLFYGLTLRDGVLYAFECGDLPRAPTARGRVVRFTLDNGRIGAVDILATGLDNGCHQIDFIGGRLCVLDTYNQAVIRFSADGSSREQLYPLSRIAERGGGESYAHVNSLLEYDGRILLLLHNGGDGRDRPSEVATLDRDWRLLDRTPLPGRDCHNIALLEDGTRLVCGSRAGELIVGERRIAISGLMTRGLSVGDDAIVIGATARARREDRLAIDGAIMFLDRDYAPRARLDLPAAPTEIRRLDGRDRGLSEFVRSRRA